MASGQCKTQHAEMCGDYGSVASRTRNAVRFLVYTLLLCAGLLGAAEAQSYTSVVVFGDSLSDVGNDASVSYAKYGVVAQVPGPATGYTNGRFTDGLDTTPPARNYTGVWIEQLATKLAAHPAIRNSLSGGTDYAYGFATTNTGTSQLTYGPSNALSITVNNMGQQVSDYLASGPTINSSTLYVVWGGANDLLNLTSATDIANSAGREVALVQQLINAGATDFLIPNLPPLGLIPRLNQIPAQSAAATAAAQVFNQALSTGLAQLAMANSGKTLHLFPLDIYTLFNTVVGPPPAPGFSNVTASSSAFFGASNASVNPDTYLFWDDLHPTTFGHNQIAAAALTLLGPPVQTTVSLTASANSINPNTTVQFTASVAATSGIPSGTVSFLDGSTVLGTALVTGSTATGTATYSTSALASGTHTIHAVFAGVNGYVSSTSGTATVTVAFPAYVTGATPMSFTIARGSTGTSTIMLSSLGGYSGTFTIACGTVPANIACSVGTSSVTVTPATTNANPATSVITINTNNVVSANHRPASFGAVGSETALAVLLFPAIVCLPLRRRSHGRIPSLLRSILFFVTLSAIASLSGCGGDPLAHDTPVGSYQIPVIVTPATGSGNTLTLSVTVQ